MEKEIKSSVKYAVTTCDIWFDLEESFGRENVPRAYELRWTIAMIHQESMTFTYLSRLHMWHLKGNYEERKWVLYDFLKGLNDDCGALRTQILSTNPLPALSNVYPLLSQDEHPKKVGTSRNNMNEVATFQISNKLGSRIITKGNSSNNPNKKEDKNMNGTNDDHWCSHCQKLGHKIDGCFNLLVI